MDTNRSIGTNTTEYFCLWMPGASFEFFVLGIIRPGSLTVLQQFQDHNHMFKAWQDLIENNDDKRDSKQKNQLCHSISVGNHMDI